MTIKNKTCEQCGITFSKKKGWAYAMWEKTRFCSPQCSATNRHPNDEDLYEIDETTGCWFFVGSFDNDGYGQLQRKSKRFRAPRYFYEKYKGPIPENLQLDHLCRNRACVNSDHLEPVTGAENIRRGDSTKLTKKQVKLIREIYEATGLQQYTLANIFEVSQQHISSIINYKHWRGV